MIIEPLTLKHDRASFTCEEAALTNYLRDWAIPEANRHLGQTHVLLRPGSLRVEGYYTLCAASLSKDAIADNKKLKYQSTPAVLIGRLARDLANKGKLHQGQTYGEILLLNALQLAVEVQKNIAAAVVVVDAMSQHAEGFYKKYQFVDALGQQDRVYPRRLYLEMNTLLGWNLPPRRNTPDEQQPGPTL